MSDPVASSSTGTGPSEPQLAPGNPQKEEALKAYKRALKNHEDLSANLKNRELHRPR